MRPSNIIRAILTIVLVFLVWRTSSWPVALSITLLAVNDVLIRHVLRVEREHRINRQKAEHNLFKKVKKLRERMEKTEKGK